MSVGFVTPPVALEGVPAVRLTWWRKSTTPPLFRFLPFRLAPSRAVVIFSSSSSPLLFDPSFQGVPQNPLPRLGWRCPSGTRPRFLLSPLSPCPTPKDFFRFFDSQKPRGVFSVSSRPSCFFAQDPEPFPLAFLMLAPKNSSSPSPLPHPLSFCALL